MLGYFVRHATAAHLVMLAMLLAGTWGLLTLRAQHWPDIPERGAIVTVRWPGTGAEEVDRQILTRLEPALRAFDGTRFTTALAERSRARVWMLFEPEQDQADGIEALRAILAALDLPDTAEPPTIVSPARRDRVIDLVVHGPVGYGTLEAIATELRDALFSAGVTRVQLSGVPDPIFEVVADPEALLRHALTLGDVAASIRDDVRTRPVGGTGDGGPRVVAGQERRTLEALGSVVLQRGDEGATLHLRDIGLLQMRDARRGGGLRVGDHPAIRIIVLRAENDDALATLRQVDEVVAELAPGLPAGVTITEMRARVRDITERLGLLAQSGAMGLGLVLILLFLFLSARTAFWVAAGIPVAMAGSLGLMAAAGFTLDMMSLFALILCLGIVVDDAIVVGERAEALAAGGLPPAVAAERAARSMFGPVLASTLTTMIGFLSLLVVGGRFGAMMAVIPLIVSVALAASLMESFVVLPAHMRQALGASPRYGWIDAPSRAVMRVFGRFRDGAFRRTLIAAVRRRYATVAIATGLLLASLAPILDGSLPWRFFHSPERGRIIINFAMQEGANPAAADAMLQELNRALDDVDTRFRKEQGAPAVHLAFSRLGRTTGPNTDDLDGRPPETLGSMYIDLTDADDRPFSQNDVLRSLDAAIRPHPRLEILRLRGERGGPAGQSLSVALTGDDARTVKAAAEALKASLATYEGITGLEDTLGFDAETLRIDLTPAGEAAGLTTEALSYQLRDRLGGIDVFDFPYGDTVAEVRLLLPETARQRGTLDQAWIRAEGGWVRLAEVARTSAFASPSRIYRENGQLVATVRGDIAEDDAAREAAIVRVLETELLPALAATHDVRYRFTGLREQEERFLGEAQLGALLCLVGIYAVLAWVFGSWSRPLVVMMVIPFGLIGAVWGHIWMDMPLSMFSVVGLIGMAGIIVNGAIVLVGAVDERMARRALIPSIVEAGTERLRAVLLTTATTVAGLMPMLADRSTQAAFLKPTAVTLVFGVSLGMVLVLVLTPALIAIEGDIRRALTALRRSRRLFGRAARRRAIGRA